MEIVQSAFGLVALTALAWLFSENRLAASWKTVVAGLGLQIVIAVVLLKIPLFHDFFLALNDAVAALQAATTAGTKFVFGYLGGGDLPFTESYPGAAFVLATQALPLVLVMSALSAVLFYWKILPVIVKGFAWALERSLGVGGAVGVSAAANVFVGMVEAPLLIRPYMAKLNRAELFMVMTCGMATIAGTVMALYAAFISQVIPGSMGHILTASLVSAPAAIMVAKLMVPDSEEPTAGGLTEAEDAPKGTMEAITRGTMDGVQLLINIIAMLIVLVALVSLVNQILGLFPAIGGEALTLQRIFGWVMAPVTWLMGVPWAEAPTAGALMGTKTVLNEFLAYLDLAKVPPDALSDRSRLIMVYALCGFANFGSLGIMIGGLVAMAPERRGLIVALGPKTLVSGTLATCLTGAVIGVLV